ncbi:hypothetical protein HNY73_019956 [Argiope bruennichi]|uniref:Uncharacterized protein n=1 Tax=Argiope bruennichi TaxID=94029 RepID=A0A8T0E916_ARGBR|nr:hypothetical protein HNY73_019956 [Argiope bruennichi]
MSYPLTKNPSHRENPVYADKKMPLKLAAAIVCLNLHPFSTSFALSLNNSHPILKPAECLYSGLHTAAFLRQKEEEGGGSMSQREEIQRITARSREKGSIWGGLSMNEGRSP